MNAIFLVKSPWRFAWVVAVMISLPATESKAGEPNTPKIAADPKQGETAGKVRDDNGLKMKLVWCPPGKFTMGTPKSGITRLKNEGQVAEVTLSTGFWLGKYEVLQTEWKQVMATEPWKGKIPTSKDDIYPASFVSWDKAIAFCRNFTTQERKARRLPDGWEYTLPTEAHQERLPGRDRNPLQFWRR